MAEASTGRRMLSEIDEASLDEILTTLRTSLNSTSLHPSQPSSTNVAATSDHRDLASAPLAKVKSYPFQDLDVLVTRHHRATQSAPLSLSGTYLPLVYKLVAALIASPSHKSVVVVDVDAKFDITNLLQSAPLTSQLAPEYTSGTTHTREQVQQREGVHASPVLQESHASPTLGVRVTLEDLKHVHVFRAALGSPSHVRDVLNSAEHYMIYSKHASATREWWGTVVIGGGSPTDLGSAHADVTTGWKGWLRVDRDEVRGFPAGISLDEALVERDQRQRAVDAASFRAACIWGGFSFDH